jgi:hypothetical protein
MFQRVVRMLRKRERSVKVEEKEIRNLRQTLPPSLLQSFFQMVINVSLLVKPQLIGLKHDLTVFPCVLLRVVYKRTVGKHVSYT